jgi:hypothetical protein
MAGWGELPGDGSSGCSEHCRVSLTIQKYLSVLDGRHGGWKENFTEQLASGSNFFVIIPNAPDFLDELAKALAMDPDRLPAPVTRHRVFALSPFIDPKESDKMLAAQQDGNLLFFIEQIDLPNTRPPRVQPFMIYCSVRGIISQHDNQPDAREACSDYLAAMAGLKNQHEATVYKWRGEDWYNTETC